MSNKKIESDNLLLLYAALSIAIKHTEILTFTNSENKEYMNWNNNIYSILEGIQENFMHVENGGISEEDAKKIAMEKIKKAVGTKGVSEKDEDSFSDEDEDEDDPWDL